MEDLGPASHVKEEGGRTPLLPRRRRDAGRHPEQCGASHDCGLTGEWYRCSMQIDDVSGLIVDAAIKVHSILGPGLLERAYVVCLAHELGKRRVRVRAEVP